MLDFLEAIDRGLYDRYLTVERNIRAASNSFYDAYLDLLEHFVKHSLPASLVPAQPLTCGALLRRAEVRAYFLETVGVDEHTYEKMQDYTLKVNAHKHKGEKTVGLETVVNYMAVFHGAAVAYAAFSGIATEDFCADYYKELFESFEKENTALKKEVIERLERAEERARRDREEILSALGTVMPSHTDEQKKEGGREQFFSFKHFVSGASQEYLWFGTRALFEKNRKAAFWITVVSVIMMLAATVMTTVSVGYYTTYTLFENIWLLLSACIMKYVYKAKRQYPIFEYWENCIGRLAFDNDGVLRPRGCKKKYKWFRILAYICFVINAIYVFMENGSYVVFAAVLELLSLLLCILAFRKTTDLFLMYDTIRLRGKVNGNGEVRSLILTLMDNKLYHEQDYMEKLPFMK